MVVMVKFTINCDFFDSFFFQSMNQAFLHHFKPFFTSSVKAFNCKCTLKGYPRKEESLCQVLATITLQVLTLFIGTALDIFAFPHESRRYLFFELICTFILPSPAQTFQGLFLQLFPQLPLLGLLLLLHFYILGHFASFNDFSLNVLRNDYC